MSEKGVRRFLDRAAALGISDLEVRTLDDSAHTAAQAAEAVGTEVDAIVKSLLLLVGGAPTLALVSGGHRVDTVALAADLAADVTMADAKTVRQHAGYSIGGVPPFAHPEPLPTLLDETLLRFDTVWAAAGSAHAVFPIGVDRLRTISDGRVVALAER